MRRKRSSPPSRSEVGFSLIELLVATAIGGVIMAIVSQLLYATVRHRGEIEGRLELHHGIKASIDALTRDLRLAGTCLPTAGSFMAFSVTNQITNGRDADVLLIRIGIRDSGRCVQTAVRVDALSGDTVLRVDDAAGFAAEQKVLLMQPNGYGFVNTIDAADDVSNEIRLAGGAARDLVTGSGVYAFENRDYFIRDFFPGIPTHLATRSYEFGSGDHLVPLAVGIDELNLRMRLDRNCPPCDVVDVLTGTDGHLVTDLEVTVGGAVPSRLVRGTDYRLTETFRVKPRNLLP